MELGVERARRIWRRYRGEPKSPVGLEWKRGLRREYSERGTEKARLSFA